MKSSPIWAAHVQAIREVTPQALHHYTRFDQVNQLVRASEADPERGFMVRMMALCSLPRTNPGNQHQHKRVNGPFKLIMYSSGETKLPFGNFPRLILAWLCTEAVRTQSRDFASAWRIWKACWKDCARPSPCGPPAARFFNQVESGYGEMICSTPAPRHP